MEFKRDDLAEMKSILRYEGIEISEFAPAGEVWDKFNELVFRKNCLQYKILQSRILRDNDDKKRVVKALNLAR